MTRRSEFEPQAVCGTHSLAEGVTARLAGGDRSNNGQWPSVALLYHTGYKTRCTASIISPRWLLSSYNCIKHSQYLHYLPIPTIDLNECNSTKHYSGFVTEDDICAGFTDVDKSPCYNDEGSPLMCISDNGMWELQGVLAHHSNCGRGYHPSIFSSVSAVRSWVETTIGSRFERKSPFNVRR
uniref:Peptidase S1 domain-containing protein n=1 Tax=Timema poppense TaxID=170557 RepID=A0A7R9H5J1_TIMPO|nr:unnamed protein product [Timema poppensis]